MYDLIDTNPVDDNIDPIFMMASAFQRDSRDTEIEVLRAEIARLQAEIEAMRAEVLIFDILTFQQKLWMLR